MVVQNKSGLNKSAFVEGLSKGGQSAAIAVSVLEILLQAVPQWFAGVVAPWALLQPWRNARSVRRWCGGSPLCPRRAPSRPLPGNRGFGAGSQFRGPGRTGRRRDPRRHEPGGRFRRRPLAAGRCPRASGPPGARREVGTTFLPYCVKCHVKLHLPARNN